MHDVSKFYGNKMVVNKATFGVKPGDCFALLGPNGAGKTTTFNMIRGETSASSGDIYVTGISINEDLSLARNHLGVCPQFDAMDMLTVTEVLHFYSKLRGVQGGRSKIQNHVDSLIAAVDLTKYRSRVAHKLSGETNANYHWQSHWWEILQSCCWMSRPVVWMRLLNVSCGEH